jgi:hypothetical protein
VALAFVRRRAIALLFVQRHDRVYAVWVLSPALTWINEAGGLISSDGVMRATGAPQLGKTRNEAPDSVCERSAVPAVCGSLRTPDRVARTHGIRNPV